MTPSMIHFWLIAFAIMLTTGYMGFLAGWHAALRWKGHIETRNRRRVEGLAESLRRDNVRYIAGNRP